MKAKLFITAFLIALNFLSFAQNGWTICNSPTFSNRVDDIFMVNTQTGYAVCGDGQIVKTIDGGNNWVMLLQDTSIYCRSVEFINTQKGFVGGFPSTYSTNNILRETNDGGTTWTDLTSLLNPKARKGICGLAIADSITIYGCGNWYQDSAYIVKSSDGGNTWNFLDLGVYASSLIDMHFISKDTGFVTGRGPAPLRTAVVLYTTDGGQNWSYKFQNTVSNEYCWKIQHLTNQIYFASIEDLSSSSSKIIKSIDGGMNWTVHIISPNYYNIEGIGFLDSLNGWAGGGPGFSFSSTNGGLSWAPVNNVCPYMNRVFKVNDTLIFASGSEIWKYSPTATGIHALNSDKVQYNSIICYPNPADENFTIVSSLSKSTHVLIIVFDEQGKQVEVVDNSDKPKGEFRYKLNTNYFKQGTYYIVFKTHEDQQLEKIVVSH